MDGIWLNFEGIPDPSPRAEFFSFRGGIRAARALARSLPRPFVNRDGEKLAVQVNSPVARAVVV